MSKTFRTSRYNWLLIFLIFFLNGCVTVLEKKGSEENSLPEQRYNFVDGGSALYYRFNLGQAQRKETALFFISGSGCASVRDRFPRYLQPISMVNAEVFLLQKRGIVPGSIAGHCSDEFVASDHFEQTVADQQAFISAMLRNSGVDYQNVVIIGASEGGIVAARIASLDRRVTHLGLIGTGGSTLRSYLTILSKQNFFWGDPDEKFRLISDSPENLKSTVWGHTYKYWSSILAVDLAALLTDLDIPIVMAMGEKDESVPVETARQLQEEFVKQKRDNFKLLIFEGANHKLFDHERSTSYSARFLLALKKTLN
ncbi:MAG: prolyl oligopeptidase family serine peptidase [Candidatus Thiodiazotropha sp. (ex Rostrolucina anterorostrata)]|nr:prolyl oligopeptidase family serine peptidase [Candidatus Thiodiazotropha sp. (ex Rostrolucina anterorostrata)]